MTSYETPKRKFLLVTRNGQPMGPVFYNRAGPAAAASKAASRGYTNPCIQCAHDKRYIYPYKVVSETIPADRQTTFQRQNDISLQNRVQSLGRYATP